MNPKGAITEETRFRLAVDTVLRHEGGLVEHPNDPGGLTNMGISLRSYPELGEEGIRNLTRAEAIEIYREDWWERYRWDEILDQHVSCKVMDLGVNVGPTTVHRLLQQALHACGRRDVAVDGILGPQTLAAVNEAEPEPLLAALKAEAAAYYRRQAEVDPDSAVFLDGWLNRCYS